MAEQLRSRWDGGTRLIDPADGSVRVCDRTIGLPVPLEGTEATIIETTLVEQLRTLLDRLDALPPLMREFMFTLARDRLDADTILVFADWLEEHGQTEAGQRVRLLRPQPGDMLVVYFDPAAVVRPGGLLELQRVGEMAADAVGVDFWVVAPSGVDFRVIDPEQLRAAGWVRAEEAEERVRAEREACAALVEEIGEELMDGPGGLSAYQAASIRARGDSA